MIKVNGANIKTPSKCQVGIFDVSSSADRNAQGEILIDRVGTKRKLEMEWSAMTNAEMSALLSTVTAVFFSVTYPDPVTGAARTMTAYVGDRTAPVYRMVSGVPRWEGLKMNFIEK